MAKSVHTQLDDDRILIVRFDQPGRPVNTLSPEVLDELSDLIGSLAPASGGAPDPRGRPIGVVFTSAKADGFVAGADLHAMRQMDRDQKKQFLEQGQALFDRIEGLDIPTVAAINGQCLGGGLELALSCTYRVASDCGSINIGLPETKLGLIPAWGGTTRLSRKIGLARTLGLLLTGRTLPPRKALRAGLIDQVVRPEALLDGARRMIRQRPEVRGPSRLDRLVAALPPLSDWVCRTARRKTLAKTCGNYPAAEKLIDVAHTAVRRGHADGLRAERDSLLHLAETEACQNLMRLFFLRQDAKRALKELEAEPTPVQHAAVVGGGTMGAGICHALVRAGVAVRLIEVGPEAASAGLHRVRRLLDDDVRAKRISPVEARHCMHRLSPAIGFGSNAGLKPADIVIEAVAEKIDVKLEVFEKLDRLTRPDTVLASNTSSLSITDLANATGRPQRVIGLHFFNPVPKMVLVEVIRTEHSAGDGRQALATGAALAARMGKVPILVGDGPGFCVNRVLIPYLAEALVMASEGWMPIDQIDRQMRQWGMPMGPFELLDQVGLDITVDIFRSVGGRLGAHLEAPRGLEVVLDRGWLGRKTGRGFYNYITRWPGSRKPTINEELIRQLSVTHPDAGTADSGDCAWRLVLPMVNEAVRLLHERIVDSPDTVDLATVLGLGLAPFRGGLIHFAHTVGLDQIVGRMDELAGRYGDRFAPLPELRELARAGRSMTEWVDSLPADQPAAPAGVGPGVSPGVRGAELPGAGEPQHT